MKKRILLSVVFADEEDLSNELSKFKTIQLDDFYIDFRLIVNIHKLSDAASKFILQNKIDCIKLEDS